MASDPQEMATVGNFEDVNEAELVCGLLVSAGLPAIVENHEAMHGFSETLPIEAHIRVLVPFSDETTAREIIAASQTGGGTTDADVAEAAYGADGQDAVKGAGISGTMTEI